MAFFNYIKRAQNHLSTVQFTSIYSHTENRGSNIADPPSDLTNITIK